MYIKRDITTVLNEYKKFPAIAIMGPRQSGKTTLSKHTFPNHIFIDFDDPGTKLFAQQDPQAFLNQHENEHGIILDEFQHVPELLSYIKIIIDQKNRPGYFVLTGSQNFLVNESITQSLAGRVGIVTLLPLSLHELASAGFNKQYQELIINGFYPRIYSQDINPTAFYGSYLQTYVEKDVRQVSGVINLTTFQHFLMLCAGRTGQLLNVADIATNLSVDQKTVTRWLSILEASYVIFLLQPYYNNFNKRLTKSPKLYFYDTGLAAYLLGIKDTHALFASSFRGPLFENFIIQDLYKQSYNLGEKPRLYFWRDQNGRIEVDCIVDKGAAIVPVEIKSSATIHQSFFDTLNQFKELSPTTIEKSYIVYAGDQQQQRTQGNVVGWESAAQLIKKFM